MNAPRTKKAFSRKTDFHQNLQPPNLLTQKRQQTPQPHTVPPLTYRTASATLLLPPTYPDGRRIWRKSGEGAVRPEIRAAVSERSEFRRPSGRRQAIAADFRRAHGLLVLFGPRKELLKNSPKLFKPQNNSSKTDYPQSTLTRSDPETAGGYKKRESPLNDSEGTLG